MKRALLIIVGLLACCVVWMVSGEREGAQPLHSAEEFAEQQEIPPTPTKEQQELRRRLRDESRRAQESERERIRPVPLDDVGPNVRVNQSGTGLEQAEFAIAASITHPDTLLAGAVDFHGADGTTPWVGFYVSLNGGESWQDVLLTNGTPNDPNQLAGDPTVCIDAEGRMYAAYISFGASMMVMVQTSVDNGATWGDPVTIRSGSVDKPYACVDLDPSSPYFGNYYIFWTETGGQIFMSRSTNGGASFDGVRAVTTPGIYALWCAPVCGPDGEVYVSWMNYSVNTNVQFDRSLDGGITWGADMTVGTYVFPGNIGCANTGFRAYAHPVLACDISNSPRRGWLYISWSSASGSDVDLLFRRSEDGGTTWSAISHIEDETVNRWQMFHWMTVHPVTGQIGASWLDWRENVCMYRCYATVSGDGGVTWEPNFPISTVASNPVGLWFIGDYIGNTFGRDGRFVTTWIDLRNDDGDLYAAWFKIPTLAPPQVTIVREDDHMRLDWEPVPGVPYYKIFSAYGSDEPYATFEGLVTTNSFVDTNAFALPKKFYVVVSSLEP
ncbi:MAG: exo-alpha-sialidase [Calditrichaeota bacterium]|nr:exo-alpha-sialidase [Calditrichota bacterium]